MPSVGVGEVEPIRKHSGANVTKIFQGDIIKVKETQRITSYLFCVAFVDVVTAIVILCSLRTKTEISLYKTVVLLKKERKYNSNWNQPGDIAVLQPLNRAMVYECLL